MVKHFDRSKTIEMMMGDILASEENIKGLSNRRVLIFKKTMPEHPCKALWVRAGNLTNQTMKNGKTTIAF